jgi:AraC-like DNA-binding protein
VGAVSACPRRSVRAMLAPDGGVTLDAREHRLAQNETLFREVNERVEAVAHQLGPEVPYEFLCECANADCTFRIALPIPVYESIRADPKQFVVLPLHYTPEIEELVVEEDGYWIVRKTGEAGEYVEHLDPRGR